MANIKELKKQIKSVKGTLKITTAMKLVSAAKLNRAQHAIQSSRPYASELEDTIKVVSALVQNYSHPYLEEKKENNRSALLLITSNKGLCGNYNSALSKEVRKIIKNNSGEEFKVYFIGKKGRDLLKNDVNQGKFYTFKKADPTFQEIQEVAKELGELFNSGEYGKIYVAYNSFKSAISFDTTVKQVLPMSMDLEVKEDLKKNFPFDFKYEPAPSEILNSLIPETYISSVYTAFLDAVASEHGSRMSAMDSASKNCKEAIRSLTLKMNKMRQAKITTELIEIISGAESLNA
ncbi:MAG: ATP synthase F1 subunit gamma [Bdellovibrio sp.]